MGWILGHGGERRVGARGRGGRRVGERGGDWLRSGPESGGQPPPRVQATTCQDADVTALSAIAKSPLLFTATPPLRSLFPVVIPPAATATFAGATPNPYWCKQGDRGWRRGYRPRGMVAGMARVQVDGPAPHDSNTMPRHSCAKSGFPPPIRSPLLAGDASEQTGGAVHCDRKPPY